MAAIFHNRKRWRWRHITCNARRRPLCAASNANRFETLESRLCLSVYYDFAPIARNDSNGITSIIPSVSINDQGDVAFVATNSDGQSVYWVDGNSSPVIASFATPSNTRSYGAELQINDASQIAAVDIEGGQRRARIWSTDALGNFDIIARSSTPRLDTSHFDGLGSFVGMANDGQLAFAGLESPPVGSGDPAFWEVNLSNALVDRRDAFNLPAVPEVTEMELPPTPFFRQFVAEGDQVVLARRTTETEGVRTVIEFHDATGINTMSPIATTEDEYWSELGIRPGISDDGSVVVFYGSLTPFGAEQLGLTPGPGIFASVSDGSTFGDRYLMRVVGLIVEDIATNPGDKDGICETGEACRPAAELGYDDTGSPLYFSSFDVDTRVGVAVSDGSLDHGESFVVAFMASPIAASRTNPITSTPLLFSAEKGIWSVRVDVESMLLQPGSLALNPTSPVPVVQLNDQLTNEAIVSLAIHDSVSNAGYDLTGAPREHRDRGDHRIAFQAATANKQFVIRAEHLDSDRDGLFDHWETEGIDIDQDGEIDLSLAVMGASPLRQDLFLEVDWNADHADYRNAPAAGTLPRVVQMFAEAPIQNPDGTTGIALHVDAGNDQDSSGDRYSSPEIPPSLSEGGDAIRFEGQRLDMVYFDLPGAVNVPGLNARSMHEVKDAFFGTHDRRARELAFRYAVFADAHSLDLVGTAAGGGPNSLSVSDDLFGNPNSLFSSTIKITTGTGAGQTRDVNGNSANQLTVSQDWTTIPDASSGFAILNGSSGLGEADFRGAPDHNGVPGNDLLVTLRGFGLTQVTDVNGNTFGSLANEFVQWRTLAHETGHTLGLRHCGIQVDADLCENLPDAYKSLMSYAHQNDGSSTIQSYSDASDPTFDDWGNVKLGFQTSAAFLGNTFGRSLGNTRQHSTEQTLADYVRMNGADLDRLAPAVVVVSPSSQDVSPLGAELAVVVNATDDTSLEYVRMRLDVNGDGDPFDTGESIFATLVDGNRFEAVFGNLAGSAGVRELQVFAADSSGNIGLSLVMVSVGGEQVTPGDTDGDRDVDLVDLNNVRNNFGGSGLGDTNDDGLVDLVDLNAVRNNFGATQAPLDASDEPIAFSRRESLNRINLREAMRLAAVDDLHSATSAMTWLRWQESFSPVEQTFGTLLSRENRKSRRPTTT